jgi:hypothetical protein
MKQIARVKQVLVPGLHKWDDGTCVADTWHDDLAAAKHQAQYEYGLTDKDWSIEKDA